MRLLNLSHVNYLYRKYEYQFIILPTTGPYVQATLTGMLALPFPYISIA